MTLEKLLKSSSFRFLSYEMVIKQLFLSYTYNIWMRTDTCYPSGIIVFLPHLLAFHRQCGLWSVSIYILCWISTPPDPKQLQACTLSCCWCIPLCPQAIARSVTLCLPDQEQFISNHSVLWCVTSHLQLYVVGIYKLMLPPWWHGKSLSPGIFNGTCFPTPKSMVTCDDPLRIFREGESNTHMYINIYV